MVSSKWEHGGSLSPYVASDSTRVRQSSLSLGFHLSLYLLTASWLLYRAGESDWTSGTHVALALTASWVLIGPMLVVTWEARLDRLQRLLDTSDEFEVDHAEAGAVKNDLAATAARVRAQTTRFRAVNTAVIPIPVVLMLIPLAVGRSFFENTVGLERFSVEYWVAAVVLVVGGISCGYGLAGASRTIVLAQALSRERGRFAPYAGIPSQMASWLADFCFSSALLFGLGGSLLFPGVTSAILGSHGVARATFVIVVVIIVGCTAALLAVPAQFLSRRHTTERDDYLNKLSKKIDVLAARAANPQATFSENEYRQLRSLLELRNHVVLQSIAQPSVEMVKRIPLAVLLPVGSTAAAWLAVLVH